MAFASTLSTLVLPLTAFSSTYILYNSVTASRLLQKYESVTKKAAKVTSKADDELWKTRYTQGAGLVASLSTTISSGLALYWSTSGKSEHGGDLQRSLFLMGCANAGLCLWVRRYMAGFWVGRARVPLPGSTEYNDAVRATERLLVWLRIVAMGWASVMAVNWDW
ncbi:hypothetical protein H2198_006655 [Neophaeococcomyces mojaviensis]|uniref:Uncharacterized protein n=1 Tax=Neophaeococcomyces mojaviensis TaxID=3383035 RepID=A0ACC3A266_9EURO|nr:hypothetical protein H2198_006655 [Knufia sp. JES_112]